ncbi:MAG: NAD(P)H-dependent oxidoreductase subunit E [Candidatus Omnitrophica bacterium]|nr:NAD(P)H-dependent oxidoreductase subunit E [Candidatus Omnitrophota bacterium]
METAELKETVQNIVNEWKDREGNLIMILHQIQNRYGYVPREVSLQLSELLDIPLARIYEVLTFYHYFKIVKPGKHRVSVCMGTACYLNGAPGLLNELEHLLGVSAGETTQDGLFQVEVVRCLGCCGLAPVMTVDGKIFSSVQKDDIAKILSDYSHKEPIFSSGDTGSQA